MHLNATYVLVHQYVAVDLDRVVDAMDRLQPIDEFVRVMAAIVSLEPGE